MRRGALLAGFVGYAVLLAVLRPSTAQLPEGGWWHWLQTYPENALLVGLSAVAWLIAAWLFLVTGLSLVATTSGAGARLATRVLRRITPFALRRTLEAALATALAVGPAGMAVAGPAGSLASPNPVSVSLSPLQPVPAPIVAPAERLPDLDRPVAPTPTPTPTPTAPATAAPTRSPDSHRVVPGDTLWDVAADALPAGASPAQITRYWQQWYALNRTAIGADPGLIRPGELLIAPQVTS